MEKVARYRQRAAALLVQAAETQDSDIRDTCRAMAEAFERMAKRREMILDGRTATLAPER
jgi:hypothetical protein